MEVCQHNTSPQKESKELAENYRPISLLSIVSKALERCVSNNLYHHVSGLISDEQYGFVRNLSCVTQLLSVFHTIGENLDKNIQTDILYLEFAKAFNSVDHCTLLAGLEIEKKYDLPNQIFLAVQIPFSLSFYFFTCQKC